MEALGGNGAFWGWKLPEIRSMKRPSSSKSKSSDSTAEVTGGGRYHFPLKQAVTAASLALTGDTIAQISDRWRKQKQSLSDSSDTNKVSFSNYFLLSFCLDGEKYRESLRHREILVDLGPVRVSKIWEIIALTHLVLFLLVLNFNILWISRFSILYY